ncbi:MAG: hypothetical protein P4L84_30225 [Isosphaeraceae bacterium]|nr:hypothetical protein [Isosphaeraceae bacterium]
MTTPMPGITPLYRLVVFSEIDDPHAARELFVRVAGVHPTDALQWVARVPGVWPQTLPQDQTRDLLDGLYELGIPAEAWRVDQFPEISPARTIHKAACLDEGFRVQGLRGEPTHWVPWSKVELISAGRIAVDDEFRSVSPPSWPSAVVTGLRALALRKPEPMDRRNRAQRIPRDPIGEVVIVRRDPRVAFRVVENQMNYAYLGDRLSHSSAENFPIFLADLCARAGDAYLTEPTRALLAGADPNEYTFESSQALLDYTTHRLLWSWYRRDRDTEGATES